MTLLQSIRQILGYSGAADAPPFTNIEAQAAYDPDGNRAVPLAIAARGLIGADGSATTLANISRATLGSRLRPLRGVSVPVFEGTPPTVTVTDDGGNTAATDITSAVTVPAITAGAPNTGRFTFTGGIAVRAGAIYPNDSLVRSGSMHVPYGTQPLKIGVLHEGQEIEFLLLGTGSVARVYVDGRCVDLDGDAITANGNFWRVNIDFGAWGSRHIELEYQLFAGARIEPDASLSPSRTNGVIFSAIGDSQMEGTGSPRSYYGSYGYTLGHLIGARDVRIVGSGGTGILATNGGLGRGPYSSYIADVTDNRPDIMAVQASINDGGTDAEYLAALNSLLNALVSACPNALLVGIGQIVGDETATAVYLDRHAIFKGRIEARGGIFLDTLSQPMLTGTGKIDGPNGDGNADLHVSGDGVHLAQGGHDYAARYLADQFIAKLGLSLP